VIDRAVRQGEVQIARATTTDAHPHPFTARLDPLVQVYGLLDMTTGAPRLLAAFALPGERLAGARRAEANNRMVYSVRFVLSALDAAGHRTDVDTTRHFVSPDPLAKGQFVSGTLEAPMSGGRYAVSLLTEQLDGPGAVSSLGGVPIPGAGRAPWISSLVLGLPGSGVTWNSGTRVVPLHPLNAFPQDGGAELYFQLGGLRPGERYQTSVEVFEAGEADGEATLSVAFTDEATGPRQEVQRRLGLENLDPGRYRIRVAVTGAGATVSETAYLAVVEQD
jgi:hypothetical protein